MRGWAWIVGGVLSLAMHGLALAAVVWMLPIAARSGVIFIHLTELPRPEPPAPRVSPAKPPVPARPPAVQPPLSTPASPGPSLRVEEPPVTPPLASRSEPPRPPEPVVTIETPRSPVPATVAEAPPAPRVESRIAGVTSFAAERLAPVEGLGPRPGPAGASTGGRAVGPPSGEADGGRGQAASRGTVATGIGASGDADGGGEYAPYLAGVRRRLQEALRYPTAARRRSLTGTVQLEILVEPSGAIGQVAVIDSSSHPVLDEAAVEAARSLPPQPFPQGLRPRPLRVRLPVVFELR